MKILISSHAFAPSIGGIETVSRLLAEQFREAGHTVVLVTQTTSDACNTFPYTVVRRPSARHLLDRVRWCDIYWHNNLSIRALWPALFLRKCTVITHQGSYCARPHGVDLVQRIKHRTVKRLPSVAVSRYVASCFETDSVVIPNPYDARIFKAEEKQAGQRDGLVFVGRLVSEKGADILLEALSQLNLKQISPRLTIVGDGPELPRLQQIAARLKVGDRVVFAGAQGPAAVAAILNRHRILVVPSRYHEPFGIVALEGIACGCLVVASRGGGLSEAVGPCGITFDNGNAVELAEALTQLLVAPGEAEQRLAGASEHLARFRPETVAAHYLEVFQGILSR